MSTNLERAREGRSPALGASAPARVVRRRRAAPAAAAQAAEGVEREHEREREREREPRAVAAELPGRRQRAALYAA